MDALNNWQTESIKRIADELWAGQNDLPLYREVSPKVVMAPGENDLSAMDIAALTGNSRALKEMLERGASINWWNGKRHSPWQWALWTRQRTCLALMLDWLHHRLEPDHAARRTMLRDVLASRDMGLIRFAGNLGAWDGFEQMLVDAVASQASMLDFHDWSMPSAENDDTALTMEWLDHWLQDCMQMEQFREGYDEIERLVLELACTDPFRLMANVRPPVEPDPQWQNVPADAIWGALRTNLEIQPVEGTQATQLSLLEEEETMKVKIYDLNQVDKMRSTLSTRYVDSDARKRMDTKLHPQGEWHSVPSYSKWSSHESPHTNRYSRAAPRRQTDNLYPDPAETPRRAQGVDSGNSEARRNPGARCPDPDCPVQSLPLAAINR